MRGIDPGITWRGLFPLRLPRMRGSTLVVLQIDLFERLYSRMRGIDLEQQRKLKESVGLPRMRGSTLAERSKGP